MVHGQLTSFSFSSSVGLNSSRSAMDRSFPDLHSLEIHFQQSLYRFQMVQKHSPDGINTAGCFYSTATIFLLVVEENISGLHVGSPGLKGAYMNQFRCHRYKHLPQVWHVSHSQVTLEAGVLRNKLNMIRPGKDLILQAHPPTLCATSTISCSSEITSKTSGEGKGEILKTLGALLP